MAVAKSVLLLFTMVICTFAAVLAGVELAYALFMTAMIRQAGGDICRHKNLPAVRRIAPTEALEPSQQGDFLLENLAQQVAGCFAQR
jgi:hypothetical protein